MHFFDKDISETGANTNTKAQILLIATRWCYLPELLSQYLLVAIILLDSDLSSKETFSPFKFLDRFVQ